MLRMIVKHLLNIAKLYVNAYIHGHASWIYQYIKLVFSMFSINRTCERTGWAGCSPMPVLLTK